MKFSMIISLDRLIASELRAPRKIDPFDSKVSLLQQSRKKRTSQAFKQNKMKTILTIIIISLIHVVSASYLKLNDVIDTVNMFRNEISESGRRDLVARLVASTWSKL